MDYKFLSVVIGGFILFTFFEYIWYTNKTNENYQVVNFFNPSDESQLINMTNFRYLRNNPAICSNVGKNKDLLLLLVHSARENLKSRSIIRKTLATLKSYKNWEIETVFMLGDKHPEKVEDFVMEFDNDMVIGEFADTCRNISYKHVMGLKWTYEFCSNSRWILKIDDDAFVNIFKVFDIIKETEEFFPQVTYVCKPWNGIRPGRTPGERFYADIEEFPGDVYPDGCLGYSFLFKTADAQKLLEASLTKKKFPGGSDDNFVTGMLRNETGLKMRLVDELYSFYNRQVPDWKEWSSGKSQLNFPIVFILLNRGWSDYEEIMLKLWRKCLAVNSSSRKSASHLVIIKIIISFSLIKLLLPI